MKLTNDIITFYLEWYNSGLTYDQYADKIGYNRGEFQIIMTCGEKLINIY